MARWVAEPHPARPSIMSGHFKQPPPILSRPKTAEDGSSGARVQMRTLCAFLLRELLDQSDEDIDQTFENYGDNLRDLYDNIIMMINAEPSNVRAKHGISRVSDIFDEYAGIAPDQRAFYAPEGIKVSKHVGHLKDDGTLAPLPKLTAQVKAPPPLSPKRT